MSKTITEIIEEANTIATETVKGKNTAERVGGCIKDAAEFVQDFAGAIKEDVESTVDAKMEEVDEKVNNNVTKLNNVVNGIQKGTSDDGAFLTNTAGEVFAEFTTDGFDTIPSESLKSKINSEVKEECHDYAESLSVPCEEGVANPLYGKSVFVFGDSHSAIGMSLWKFVALYGGCDVYALNRSNSYFTVTKYEKSTSNYTTETLSIKANCDEYNWSQYVYVINNYATGHGLSVDYLITENCHYGDWSSLLNDNPVIYTGLTTTYPTQFESASAASSYFANNISSIISELGLTHDNASIYLQYLNSASQRLDFAFSSGSTLSADTDATITFGTDTTHKMTTTLTAGMSLTACIDAINQWEFSEFSDWKNANKSTSGNEYINISYVGGVNNDKTAQAKISFSVSCNLTMTATFTSTYRLWDCTFKGTSSDDLTNTSLWLKNGGNNGWTYPNYLLGAMEYVKNNMTSTKVVIMGIENYSSANLTATFDSSGKCTNSGALFSDGTINARAILNSSSAIQGRVSKVSSKSIASKYGHQFIDMSLYDGINPYNMYADGYYSYNNVHLNIKGYDAWAKTLINYIK